MVAISEWAAADVATTTAGVADADTITAGPAVGIGVGAKQLPTTFLMERLMKKLILSIAAATSLLTTAAFAAPLSPASVGNDTGISTEQVRLVCDEYGRCYRTRGPRYVQRGYGYGGGYDRGYMGRDYDRGYERRGYGGDGPSIGFSFGGGRGW